MTFPVSATPYPGGAGTPASPVYAGRFIPELWAGKIIEKFYAATTIGAITNTDYEGLIQNMGDTIHIRTKPDITINVYEADMDLAVERPSSDIVDLLIDTGWYWNTVLDDVMEVQSDLNMMSMWSDDAAEQMKITTDADVFGAKMLGTADSANSGATAGALSGNIDLGVTTAPITVDSTNVIDQIVNYGQVLDEQNIPETGRWMVIPAWYAARIKRSELRDASLTGDGLSMARNGRIGMIDRFTLYMSNLLPRGGVALPGGGTPTLAAGETVVYFGHQTGLSFASQLTKVETLRSESTFGTLMRGLQVYGYKTTDATALGESVVTAG